VTDLSSTKGALVSRIDSMSKREQKRQKSTAEISNLLRDAEVVAADKQVTARKLQAHAGRLEEQLVEVNARNESLEQRLAAAEAAQAELTPQLAQITAERDKLKIDIQFFQKQIGAMQRNAAKPSAPAPVRPVVMPVAPPAPVPAPAPELVEAPVLEAELEPIEGELEPLESLDDLLPSEWSEPGKK
jgi:DNA repair exonuclease SbcCD ATPase subunit